MNNENQIFLQELGRLIKDNRKRMEKTKEFLADYLDTNVIFINNIEVGQKEVPLPQLSRLNRLYDLDLMSEVDRIISRAEYKHGKLIRFSSLLGGLISVKRKEHGISQDDLAKQIQLTRLTLSKIESGEANISAQKLIFLDSIFRSELTQEIKKKIKNIEYQQDIKVVFDEQLSSEEKIERKKDLCKYISGTSTVVALLALLR